MRNTKQRINHLFLGITIIFLTLPLSNIHSQNVKVFILAGQSNMQGHGNIDPVDVKGTLSNFMNGESSKMFQYLQNTDGSWATREDVWVRYDHENGELLADKLKVGFGASVNQIGPELGFGHLLGEYFQDQILIIKTCWGGKSLAVDFRPPSSGGSVGHYYNQIISDVSEAIDNIAVEFPQYNGGQIEIAGFCWFQGWNDGEEDAYLNEYEENLKNLISDIRTDLNAPNLPFVIGLTGNGGYDLLPGDLWVQNLQTRLVPAQINAAEYPGHSNVYYAETRGFWRADDLSPEPNAIHHWMNNAESYLRIGNELGLKMIESLDLRNTLLNVIPELENVSLFPSPASNYFQVECEGSNLHLNILDVNGRLLKSLKNVTLTTKVDVTDLEKGIYLVDVLNIHGNRITVKKIVKQ